MRQRIVLLSGMLTVSLWATSPAGATPTPPVIVVNHSTRQCAVAIQGDDCHWCEPFEGWEILGDASSFACPAGYEDLGFQGLTGNCRGYRNQFCCSNGIHRGDCEDLVINESEKLCAFVEELTGCSLPEGWASAAPETEWDGLCPHEYQWVADLACIAAPEAVAPTAAASPSTVTRTWTDVVPPTTTPEPAGRDGVRRGIVWVAAIALGGAVAVVVGLLLRRWRR